MKKVQSVILSDCHPCTEICRGSLLSCGSNQIHVLTMELIYFFCKTSVCFEKFCVLIANQFYADLGVCVCVQKRGE